MEEKENNSEVEVETPSNEPEQIEVVEEETIDEIEASSNTEYSALTNANNSLAEALKKCSNI